MAKIERAGFLADPVEQLLQWLERSNVDFAKQTTAEVPVSFTKVNLDRVYIQAADSLSENIKSDFFHQGSVLWPRHPFNTKLSLPHALDRETESRNARMTASRSIAFPRSGRIRYSVKMGTDHLHPNLFQPSKASTADDVISSVRRTKLVEAVDKQISPISGLMILKDVLSVADRNTNEGFIVRDLTPLDDGNYYLPAHSIPYVGASIAALHGKSAPDFWQKHYARRLGEVHAQLLLRYCINLESPNAQNMFVQLDKSLYPTGTIVLLDIGDSSLIRPVCEGLDLIGFYKDEAKKDNDYQSEMPTQKLPFLWTTLPFGFFEKTGVFSPRDIHEMDMEYSRGYAQTLVKSLNIEGEMGSKLSAQDFSNNEMFRLIQEYFKSSTAITAVKAMNDQLR